MKKHKDPLMMVNTCIKSECRVKCPNFYYRAKFLIPVTVRKVENWFVSQKNKDKKPSLIG